MDIRKLQRAIVDGLEDVKAQNIVVFNTEHLTPLFERVIIASGTSNRQTKALASSVRDAVKSRGLQVLRTEGEDNGEWIIVDCGAAVAHIMQPAIREYYHLEELWGGKLVKMKFGDEGVGLVKAEATRLVAAPAAPARKARAAQPAPASAGRKPAPGVSAKTTAKAAPKPAAKAPAKLPPMVTVKVAAKSPAKLPARTPVRAAAKAAPKKVAAKTAAKKTAGRAAPRPAAGRNPPRPAAKAPARRPVVSGRARKA